MEKKLRESDIERYLVQRVKEAGGEVRKLKWIGRNGAPDRFVLLPNDSVFLIEIKAPGKKLALHQIREIIRLDTITPALECVVVDSFESVDQALDL